MMNTSLKTLNQISDFLKIPVKNIHINEKELLTCTIDKKPVCGFINIVSELLRKSSVLNYNGNIEIYQWLEYALVYASKVDCATNSRQILDELNEILANRTYLVLNILTVADVTLFYFLHNTMAHLSNVEKEKYINVCRWFDNLQQNQCLTNRKELVQFNTNYLSLFVPLKHL
ncbi:eukaryotic translation elongation factor 1 epsilon-1 [Agrilus planipennis]|uniref:Eukaryotic translation elongation factor 1 epsilon-1 n=1 Tax=Agrilus planipennis TaxID=224129 RepID=A0A1W4WMQ6_AGRPL|nr:eukaryotic translation elongation factor 1 epsilon-1 [Agrilus planipennis]